MTMKRIVMLLVWTLCFLFLCSCGEKNELPETLGDVVGTEEEKQSGTEQESYEETSVTVGEKVFSVQEINTGIQRTLQNILYLYGNDEDSAYIFHNQNRILHQKIEYDLFFREIADGGAGHPTKVYFRITNFLHPLSTEECPLLYEFGIDLTEKRIALALLL